MSALSKGHCRRTHRRAGGSRSGNRKYDCRHRCFLYSNCILYRAKWIVRVRFSSAEISFYFHRGNLGNLWIFTHFCSITLSFITVRILWCSLYAAICLWGEFKLWREKRRLCPLSICLYVKTPGIYQGRTADSEKGGQMMTAENKVSLRQLRRMLFIEMFGAGALSFPGKYRAF